MNDRITVRINGLPLVVTRGTTVAAAIALAGEFSCRTSVTLQRRGPVCGMGICSECRVTIDGQSHRRSCLIRCAEGMEVTTDA